MKKVLTFGIMGMALLIVSASAQTSTESTASAAATARVSAARAHAAETLSNILADANQIPLELYPPEYLDLLQGEADGDVPFAAMVALTEPQQQLMRPMNQAQGPPPDYAVIDLGASGGNYSQAFGINNNGQVVGFYGIDADHPYAFMYSNGSMQSLGTTNGYNDWAYAINNSGEAVGDSFTEPGTPWHGLSYYNGSIQNLGTLEGSQSQANGINDNGQIVGSSTTTGGINHAFLYQNGSMQDLGPLGGYSQANGINSNAQIVGSSDIGGGVYHGFLYENGSMQDIGTLGGSSSFAIAINNYGQITGDAYNTNGGDDAFLYSSGSMQDLGTLGGSASSGRSINNNGQIVGWSYVSGSTQHAFLYQGGSMYDLNSFLVESNSSVWTLEVAFGINDQGQIVGQGINPSGQTHAFLLNPLPPGALFACTNNQTALPPYGTVPAPLLGQDSLVFITHGWIPIGDDPAADTAWVDQMSNSISQYLTAHNITNWRVVGYKWTQQAQPPIFDPDQAAQTALVMGKAQGVVLGSQIASQGWSRVHLIAHSAGAGLIDLVASQVKGFSPSTVVQCTFLDPFVGLDSSGYAQYGSLADWSDNYFSRDVLTGKYTEGSLSNAYNVDVSQLDTVDRVQLGYYVSGGGLAACYRTESTHGWPIAFYTNTISGNVTSNYETFGWPLSQEAGLFEEAKSSYPVGNDPAVVLGNPDPPCSLGVVYAAADTITYIDGVEQGIVRSLTGTVDDLGHSAYQLFDPIGSPVWMAIVNTPTNAVNTVSFDLEFTSAEGADGLLSVYWDTNMIGQLDEAAVQPGLQHYTLAIPIAAVETSHVLGFHLDPFTDVQSSILLTNVAVSAIGVTQEPVLSIVTNTFDDGLVFQLTGQPANYAIQATTNLASTNWTDIAIVANTNGSVRFADPDQSDYSARFYRAASE